MRPDTLLAAELISAFRQLRRSPGFAFLATGILAVGIGSVTATYTVLNQVVLRPLPIPDQDRIVVAWSNDRVRGVAHFPHSGRMLEAVERGGVPALEAVAAVGSWGTSQAVLESPDGTTPFLWSQTLGDFFGVLGVEPVLGRTLRLEDDVPAPAELVAVISDALWASRFGRAADAVGSQLRTRRGDDLLTFTIVGVLPGDFDFPRGADVWTPTRALYPDWDEKVPHLELDLVARLTPGATPEQAAEQLAVLSRSTPELARVYAGADPVVRPFTDVVLGDLRPTLLVLFGGAVLVLLVAALDVANLVLVRAVGRRRAMGIRRALGAGPGRLLREAASEAAVLGVGAAVAGAALAWIALRVVLPLAPAELPRLGEVHGLDATAYLLAAALSALVVVGAVLLPLWRAGRTDPAEALRGGARGTDSGGGARARGVLVSGQIALAVWVLAVGLLLTRTVVALQGLSLGFRADNLIVVALDYAGGLEGRPGWSEGLRAATEEIRRAPGILGATPLQMAPLPGTSAWQTVVFKEGQSRQEAVAQNAFLMWEYVEPDAFDVLGIPVARGRGIRDTDDEAAPPVVVVNETAARLYWPGQEALGQYVQVPFGEEGARWTVVGVLRDTRYGELTDLRPSIYFPLRQMPLFHSNYLVVRTDDTAPPVLSVVREAVSAHAPDFRPLSAVSARSRLDAALVRPRFAALLLSVFAAVALALAAVGTYGIMAFLVRSRRPEIGIRLACGATPWLASTLVLRHALVLALVGAALGGAGAAASGALFEGLLYGVPPSDPMTLAAAAGIAALGALAACWVPARRAAAVDPAEALRGE